MVRSLPITLPVGTGTSVVYIDASGNFMRGLSIGTTYGVTNGLSAVSTNTFGLGGTLTQNTLIGTSSSYFALGINLTSPSLYLSSGGLVGIGTSNPLYNFQVNGTGLFSGSLGLGATSVGSTLSFSVMNTSVWD